MVRFEKYTIYTPKQRIKRRALIGLSVLCIVIGLYIFWILQAANLKPLTDAQQAAFTPHEIKEKQLIIPKIAVNNEIFQGQADVLQNGIWNRFPERGTPDVGGTFILSGHRFVFDDIPQKEISKMLDKPISALIQRFTDNLNDSNQYFNLESLIGDLKHPAIETEKEEKLKKIREEVKKNPAILDKITCKAWETQDVEEGIMNMVATALIRFK